MPSQNTVVVVTFHHESEGAIYDPMAFASLEAAKTHLTRSGWNQIERWGTVGWERDDGEGYLESAEAKPLSVHN